MNTSLFNNITGPLVTDPTKMLDIIFPIFIIGLVASFCVGIYIAWMAMDWDDIWFNIVSRSNNDFIIRRSVCYNMIEEIIEFIVVFGGEIFDFIKGLFGRGKNKNEWRRSFRYDS